MGKFYQSERVGLLAVGMIVAWLLALVAAALAVGAALLAVQQLRRKD